MKNILLSVFLVFVVGCATPTETRYQPIPLDGFADVIKHWRDKAGGQDENLYSAEQIVEIADNLILYQRDNGGWPVNKDPLRILSPQERDKVLAEKNLTDTSLDNRNTYPQIDYLARVYHQTRDPRHRDAALRGIEYILDAQYDNGGWAHSPPNTEGYRGLITFMDDVMPGVLGLLRKVAVDKPPFEFIEPAIRQRAADAVRKGDTLVLQLQIVVDGVPTVWAGQYDPKTLVPVAARSYELAGLVSWESSTVVRYLMSIENPSAEVIHAIKSAVAWFDKSKIHGLRIEKVPTEPVRFEYYTSTHDLKEIRDPDVPPIWARFYEIGSNRPFMANRDGSKVYSLEAVLRERRTGYDWYGYYGTELLEKDYPAWEIRISAQK